MVEAVCPLYYNYSFIRVCYCQTNMVSSVVHSACSVYMCMIGFTAVVIENNLKGDQLNTNMVAITDKIADLGAENILCIMTTTSCFAPRAVDR